jgi:hypothetical protein
LELGRNGHACGEISLKAGDCRPTVRPQSYPWRIAAGWNAEPVIPTEAETMTDLFQTAVPALAVRHTVTVLVLP